MDRIKKPQGLIRYSSQIALETGSATRVLRARVAIYAIILIGLLSTLALLGRSRPAAEITILRGVGSPFSISGDEVVNQLRLKVTNRSERASVFNVVVLGMPEAKLIGPELPLKVPPSEQSVASFFVLAPRSAVRGSRRVELRIGSGEEAQVVAYTLLGPEGD
ncbi:MAG: cytochrome c oxidase accessory protein CcoG [Polyangiaceae bacterium]|nr:cytochrome c oxidase accessory protein CcoG [Polyangiaceae bacterium]